MRYGKLPLGLLTASGGACKVYAVLDEHRSRRTSAAWPGAAAIAALMGTPENERRVFRWLDELEQGRWIERVQEPGRPTTFRLSCAPGIPWPTTGRNDQHPTGQNDQHPPLAKTASTGRNEQHPTGRNDQHPPLAKTASTGRNEQQPNSNLESGRSSGTDKKEAGKTSPVTVFRREKQGNLAGVPQLAPLPAFSISEKAGKETRTKEPGRRGGAMSEAMLAALVERARAKLPPELAAAVPVEALAEAERYRVGTTFGEELVRAGAANIRWPVAALMRLREELTRARATPIHQAGAWLRTLCRSHEAPGERALEEAGRLLKEHQASLPAPKARAVGDRIGGI
jgi:hypothetical protein